MQRIIHRKKPLKYHKMYYINGQSMRNKRYIYHLVSVNMSKQLISVLYTTTGSTHVSNVYSMHVYYELYDYVRVSGFSFAML